VTLWQVAGFGLAAVLVFWMLGAYNRLVGLRNAVAAAWRPLDEALAARAAAVGPLLSALREPLAAEAASLDALLSATARVDEAAGTLRAQPARAPAAGRLADAEAAFAPACTRVLALVDASTALREDAAVAPGVAALQALEPRLGFARQAFNDAVQAYNEAIAQWPTRLLSRLFGLPPAGRL